MKIQAIITGITNMKDDNICISAYDANKRVFIRPLLVGSRLSSSFLSRFNGLIRIGTQIEFDVVPPPHEPIPPHSEDTWIEPSSVIIKHQLDYPHFKDFISSIVDKDITSIYGYGVELLDGQPVIPPESGERSLGAIICRKCIVYSDYMGKIRCDITDRSGSVYRKVPVVARDEQYKKIGEYTNIPIRMGLSRPFKKSIHEEEYCWVHVSAIFS
jgi:hypothetical protein